MDQLDAAIQLPPPRIELQPIRVDEIDEIGPAGACARELAGLGFEAAGTYEVLGFDGVRLTGLIHPLTQVAAAIWLHQTQLRLELVTTFKNGTSLTSANHGEGQLLGPPGHEQKRWPGVAPAELYRRHLADRGDKPVLTLSAERFAEAYQEHWSDEQDWLAARGGYSLEELRLLVQGQGKKVSEESLVFLRERIAASALRNWYATLLAPPFPYEEIKECLVVVHDELSRDRTQYLFDRWSSGLDLPNGLLTPRQVFATLRGREDACLERVWTKHIGLEADYYCPKELVEILRGETERTGRSQGAWAALGGLRSRTRGDPWDPSAVGANLTQGRRHAKQRGEGWGENSPER